MHKNSHIQLASYDTCTGCAACVSICPTGSISMKEDREGFLQPRIDTKTCIGCHKCEKTCPVLNPIKIPTDFETKAYATINKDEDVRMRSSSGGMFHALAKWTTEQGGVVFGARFNEQWEVVHDYTETIEGIEPFMRSKYVQSRIGETFKQAKQFLDQGRWVLYSGTPCQIGGLYAYLHKDYDKLLTVDLICHGVPSPTVWEKYWRESVQGKTLVDFNFRDKRDGWIGFQCVTTTTTTKRERNKDNIYERGFLENVYLRESCYRCSFKQYHRQADITLADFWGVQHQLPEFFDNKGTSLVYIHTAKADEVFKTIISNMRIEKIDGHEASKRNPHMQQSAQYSQRKKYFYLLFNMVGFRKAYVWSQNCDENFTSLKKFLSKVKRKIKK